MASAITAGKRDILLETARTDKGVTTNLLTQHLKRRPMLRQMRESVFHQTLHVRVAIDTQKIQSSDWPK